MRAIPALVAALTLVACAASEPRIQTGPEAETTFDGLVRIDHSAFDRAWVDPDVDLTSYDKIIPGKAEFEFRAVKKSAARTSIRLPSRDEFWIEQENRDKLIDTVSAVFSEELAKSEHFTVVDTPGPDTLIVTGGLLDIVSQVPPEFIGSSEIYLSSLGEATLVLELRDSLSGETIYRAIERSRIERPSGDLIEANRVTTWVEVRRWARRWASRLTQGLDRIHGR